MRTNGPGKGQGILISKFDDVPTFEVLVRRSFAEYLALWLQHAGAGHCILFELP